MIGSKMKGSPISMFYGDPVDLTSEAVSDAVLDPTLANEVREDAAVEGLTDPQQIIDRADAYAALPKTEQANVTLVHPMVCYNARIIVDPAVKGFTASNLNYNLQRCLLEYPRIGKVVVGKQTAGQTECVVTLDKNVYSQAGEPLTGFAAVPFLRFNISASTLNARVGGNYSVWCVFKTADGTSYTTERYTIQRADANKAIQGIYVPFHQIATRTLPMLAIFGASTEANELVCEFHVDGMDPNLTEVLTITHPGYSTKETVQIAELYGLPAGYNI